MSYRKNNQRGQMHIDTGTTLAFTSANTYEKIVGTWTDGCANNFTISDVNDRITYNGNRTMCAVMNGVSDISVNKACTVTFALYKNGSLLTGAETPHTFGYISRYSTISITTIIEITQNDYFEVWAKADDTSVTLTINSLKILFFGER
jgi:hypothetical protein